MTVTIFFFFFFYTGDVFIVGYFSKPRLSAYNYGDGSVPTLALQSIHTTQISNDSPSPTGQS